MSWKGEWDKDHTTFTGSYAFPDGTVFTGEARHHKTHVIVPAWPAMGQAAVEQPIEPHYEFHGTWEKDKGAGPPMMPPDPPK